MKKIQNFFKNKKNRNLFITFLSILFTLIIVLLILIFPINKHNPDKIPYSVYLEYKENLDKYNKHYEIYQLNTTNIFKIDNQRENNQVFTDALNSTLKNVKNIKEPNEIDTSNDKLKIIVSNQEGLSNNNTYQKTLELLKKHSNIHLYIIGANDTSYSKDTILPLNQLHSEAVYMIYSLDGDFSITDIDTTTIELKSNKRPQVYLYVYYSIWNIEKNYFIDK